MREVTKAAMVNLLPALFWTLSAISAGLCVLTAAVPKWLERFVGITPDAGDGSSEWGLALTLLVAALGSAALALRARRCIVAPH